MKCKTCGAQLNENGVCDACGARAENEATQTTYPTASGKDYQAGVKRENWRLGGGCILRNILGTVMCFILFVSMYMIAVFFGTHDESYTVVAFNTEAQAQSVTLDTFYYESDATGDQLKDEQYAEYEKKYTKEYPAPKWQLQKRTNRSKLTSSANLTVSIITQIFAFFIYFSILYGKLWSRGDSDHNLVQFKRIRFDRWRGAKIGVIAELPLIAVWLFLVIGKAGIAPKTALLTFLFSNFHLFSIVSAATRGAESALDLSSLTVLLLALTLLLIPLICHVAYTLGYKRISVREKIVYKNRTTK